MEQTSRVSIIEIESSSSQTKSQRAKAVRRYISFFSLTLLLCSVVSSAALPLNVDQSERANFAFSFLIPTPLTYLLMPVPNAPTNLEVVSPLETSTALSALIQIRWTASSGATSYQIERSTNISQGFTPFATTTTTTFNDTPPSSTPPASVQTYLYRVRALDSSGSASAPSNIAFATSISFTDPTITPRVTVIRGQHLRELRWAVDAVRRAANLSVVDWTDPTPEGVVIQADHIRKLREKLGEALAALSVPVAAYTDPTLYTGANGTFVKHEHFEELRERSTRGSSTSSGPNDGGGNNTSSSTARLDPLNQTGGGGENPLSGNFNWSLPLVGLKGRAGLDLGISLSYNSLIWTKSGSSISFDDDRGFPAPGFHLGFPVIQSAFYNTEAGKYAFMLIAPDGGRTELRQVGSSLLYESADSSYLVWDAGTLTLSTTDGTKLSYALEGGDYKCVQVKDSNGNYLTITYTGNGQIDTIVDTLSRTIKFNYDATSGFLSSITQDWKVGDDTVSHPWARFTYSSPDLPIQTSFSNLTVLGPQNGTTIKVLTQVKLDDESHFDFDYTSWGQVWKVRSYAPNGDLLNYRAYNLPGSALRTTGDQDDCPRFTERHDWAENWNRNGSSTGASGLPSGSEQDVVTHYNAPEARTWTLQPNGSSQTGLMSKVTMPDGSYQMIYYAGEAGTSTAWRRGLASVVETYDSSNTQQRQAVTLWTQDDEAAHFLVNPRVSETHIYDPSNNHKRTRITYQSVSLTDGTSYDLPQDVYEYEPNATTILRYTHTTYNLSTTYTSRRIIGLVSEKTLYEGDPNSNHTLMSQVGFAYDETDSIQGANPSVQHDNTNYGASFVIGRGLLTSIKRYNVDNTAQFTVSSSKYNTAGAIVSTTDPLGHGVSISYADDFSDSVRNSLNTLAYPTMVTDPDGFKSYSKYNYDFGAVTWTRTPKPNVTDDQFGPEKTFDYDAYGRIQKVTNSFNSAYTRYVYQSSGTQVDTYATIQDGAGEAHSFTITDGLGRVIATASSHPNSTGGFSGQLALYDVMGQVLKKSNPTETTADTSATPVNPAQWIAKGDDDPTLGGPGWVFTQQAYDWKGRPTVTTNPDNTTKVVSYGGCGCAGGEVVTITDEVRHQQRVTSDILGRTKKTEVFNMDTPQTVYSTVVNDYNSRDQIKSTKHYQGTDALGNSYQEGSMTYDGYGRLLTSKSPEQTSPTTYSYYDDDTTHVTTDARQATATFTYNSRRQVKTIMYDGPSDVATSAPVTFDYDAVGNRISMTDGMGGATYHYDMLSRMDWEERTITGVGTYHIGYSYNLSGKLTSITDHFGAQVGYDYDQAGRLLKVTGSGFGNVSEYAYDMRYRAWDALKGFSFDSGGNNQKITYSFNPRMQISQLEFRYASNNNVVAGEQFQYYANGQISYSHELIDPAQDRAYTYDQVGRFKQALTGQEARGETVTVPEDVPFQQNYDYDVWGNLTSRTGKHWGQNVAAFSATYDTSGRNTAWTYDANGNLKQEGNRQYGYDSAGRNVSTTEPPIRVNRPSMTITQAFDGDGRRVKLIENGVTTYELRSTVLGGATVTDLNGQGAKTIGYVYANGKLLAMQQQSSGKVTWTHQSPDGTGEWNSYSDSIGTVRAIELDPLQNDMGVENPSVTGGSGGGDGRSYPMSGDPDMPNTCALNDNVLPCDYVFKVVRREPIIFQYFTISSRIGAPTSTSMTNTSYDGGSIEIGKKTDFQVDPKTRKMVGAGLGVTVVGTPEVLETIESVRTSMQWVEMRPVQQIREALPENKLNTLVENYQKFLDDKDCAKYLETLVAALPSRQWQTDRFKGSFMDAFNRIKNGGGFGVKVLDKALALTNPNTLTTDFSPQIAGFITSNNADDRFEAVIILIHELIHVYTESPNSGVYSHGQMALAAYQASQQLGLATKWESTSPRLSAFPRGMPTRDLFTTSEEYDAALAWYANASIQRACSKVKL